MRPATVPIQGPQKQNIFKHFPTHSEINLIPKAIQPNLFPDSGTIYPTAC